MIRGSGAHSHSEASSGVSHATIMSDSEFEETSVENEMMLDEKIEISEGGFDDKGVLFDFY